MKERLQAQLTLTKQHHILDAAARVFSEKGFHAATIKDVAAAAGVAHGSIYTYFENKEALLLGLFDLMTERARADLAPTAPPGDDLHAFLRDALRHPLAALTSQNAELFRVVVSEALVNRAFAGQFRARLLDPMTRSIADLLGATLFSDSPRPGDFDVRVRAMSGALLGVIVQRVLSDDVLEARWDDVPDVLAAVLLRGLKGEAT